MTETEKMAIRKKVYPFIKACRITSSGLCFNGVTIENEAAVINVKAGIAEIAEAFSVDVSNYEKSKMEACTIDGILFVYHYGKGDEKDV